MNNHFHDTLYYLKRAGYHAKLGVLEMVGRTPDPEPRRRDVVRTRLTQVRTRASDTVSAVRDRVDSMAATSGERNA